MNDKDSKAERWLWGITVFLVLIGIGIVVHRLLVLSSPAKFASSRSPIPDNGFAEHPILTRIHIIPGLIFMLLAPLQFIKRLRTGYPRVHRFMGYIVLTSGIIIGTTALIMGYIMAIGGITETSAVTVYGVLFLISLTKVYLYMINGETGRQREWMIRALAIGLAVATTRPIMILFVATSSLTGLTVQQFFGIAFWIAFTSHIIVAEVWIRRTRGKVLA
ncbi:MAG TPA: DUF2306 domain-containing protein [Mucilaginibacter sp.]